MLFENLNEEQAEKLFKFVSSNEIDLGHEYYTEWFDVCIQREYAGLDFYDIFSAKALLSLCLFYREGNRGII
jgi:hypothetical protein